MGLGSKLARFFRDRRLMGSVEWSDEYFHDDPPRHTAAGMPVSAEYARQLTTVSACVSVIAETVATTPLLVYREIPAGKERAVNDWRYKKLRNRPNRWQNSLEWREMMTGHAALRGVGYSEMVGRTSEDLELIPRHPDRVQVLGRDRAGFATVYGVSTEWDPRPREVPASRMFVLGGRWGGKSPVRAHCEAISLGLAMQEFAARYFGNGARPGGLLKAPAGAKLDKQQRDRIKESWEDAHRGAPRSHRIAVLENGLEWQQVGLDAEDSQLLQSRQHGIFEICRIWSMPPYKVQEYGRATWNNSEQQAIDFLSGCMLAWFRRWEEAIRWYLVDEDEPITAEFLLEGLLRGDTETRFQAYNTATGGRAWMSPNEVRERENMNRLPGLDEVAPVAQGAAPPPRGSPARPQPADDADDDDEDEERDEPGALVWSAWAGTIADCLVSAELRAIERVENLEVRDRAAFADWCREFYGGKHREYVAKRFGEMASVWLAATPLPVAVRFVVASGVAWATVAPRDVAARRDEILAVLAEGRTHDLAA